MTLADMFLLTVLACSTMRTFAQGPMGADPGAGYPPGAGFPPPDFGGGFGGGAGGTDPAEMRPWAGQAGGFGAVGGGFVPPPLRKAAIGMPPCNGFYCNYQGENSYKFTLEQVQYMVKRLDKYPACPPFAPRQNCSMPAGASYMWRQGLCYCKPYHNGRVVGDPKCVINDCGGCWYDFYSGQPGGMYYRVVCD